MRVTFIKRGSRSWIPQELAMAATLASPTMALRQTEFLQSSLTASRITTSSSLAASNAGLFAQDLKGSLELKFSKKALASGPRSRVLFSFYFLAFLFSRRCLCFGIF